MKTSWDYCIHGWGRGHLGRCSLEFHEKSHHFQAEPVELWGPGCEIWSLSGVCPTLGGHNSHGLQPIVREELQWVQPPSDKPTHTHTILLVKFQLYLHDLPIKCLLNILIRWLSFSYRIFFISLIVVGEHIATRYPHQMRRERHIIAGHGELFPMEIFNCTWLVNPWDPYDYPHWR